MAEHNKALELRLADLKQKQVDELKSDSCSQLYITDLNLSILAIEKQLGIANDHG